MLRERQVERHGKGIEAAQVVAANPAGLRKPEQPIESLSALVIHCHFQPKGAGTSLAAAHKQRVHQQAPHTAPALLRSHINGDDVPDTPPFFKLKLDNRESSNAAHVFRDHGTGPAMKQEVSKFGF